MDPSDTVSRWIKVARGPTVLLRRDRRSGALRLRQLRARLGSRGSRLGQAGDDLHGDALGHRARCRRRPGASAGIRGRRVERSPGAGGGPLSGGVPGGAGRASSLDRRGRSPREDDDVRDDRVRPPRARARSGVDHRRRRASARRQRGRGGGLARCRGRRVGSLDRAPASGDRGGDQHRGRPPRGVRLSDRARVVLRGVAGRCAESGSSLGAGARAIRARGAGRAQPDERRRGTRCARAGRRVADPTPSPRSHASRASEDGSSWSPTVEVFVSTTTTRTIRPRSRSRSRPRDSVPRGGSSPSTSRTSTSARVSSSRSWATRSGSRTRPLSRT